MLLNMLVYIVHWRQLASNIPQIKVIFVQNVDILEKENEIWALSNLSN